MKLNVVKHRAGKVIATCEKAQGDTPSVTELDHSHTVHEIAAAKNYLQSIERRYHQPGK